jgi:hypothetical protein
MGLKIGITNIDVGFQAGEEMLFPPIPGNDDLHTWDPHPCHAGDKDLDLRFA